MYRHFQSHSNRSHRRGEWMIGALLLLSTASNSFAQPDQTQRELTAQEAERLLELHSSIAWGTLNQGRMELAEQMFRDILRRDQNRPEEIAGLASALAQLGRFDEAIDVLRGATRMYPGNARLASMLGQAHLTAGNNSSAKFWLREAYWLDPYLPDVGYFLGSSYLNCQYPLSALDVMRCAPTSGDEMRWTQDLGIGLAYSQLSLQSLASGHFMSVANEAAGTPLAEQALALQTQLDESVFDQPLLSGSLKISERFDSNPGVIPAANVGGGGLAAQPSAGNQYVGQVTAALVRDYDYDLTAGYSFFHTSNYLAHEFDILDNGVYVSADRRLYWHDMPTYAGLRLDVDHLLLGSEDFLLRFLATPTVTFMTSDLDSTTVLMRYGLSNFLSQGAGDGTPFDLDSNNLMAGFQRQRQMASRKLSVYGGYQYDHNFAEGSDFDYNGNKLLIGASWLTPWHDIRVDARGEIYFRSYDNPDSVLGFNRDDEEYTVDIAVVYPLRDDWNLWFNWNFDRNDSNTPTNDYRRYTLDAGIEYRFGQPR